MKSLGLDLGSKTLGIAISDKFGILASVHSTFRFEEENYDLAVNHTIELVIKDKISTIVLGYPKHMNGDIGIRAKISEEFKRKINEKLDVEIILFDERLTSVEVNKIMITGNVRRKKRKEKKDELAAVVILQAYLDSKK